MNRETLEQLMEARRQRKPVALVTTLDSGAQRLIGRDDMADDTLASLLDEAFRSDRSGVHSLPEGEFFVHVHNPPVRLVIVGAVHTAQSLIPIAQGVGYDVAVIDPRGAFATGARFPGITLYDEWPDEVLPKIGLDRRTGMIALTHDPKIDDPALSAALKSEAFYIGALGSQKTHAKRRERLKAQGFADEQIARIRAPIGLGIGAQGPAEIAISIMAEVTKVLRLGN